MFFFGLSNGLFLLYYLFFILTGQTGTPQDKPGHSLPPIKI